jgi:thiosulfate dehydrogenase [quinone] large subunit
MQRFQTVALVALRMLIGWHFLYEGLAKLTNAYWTSAGYLAGAQGPFGEMFSDLAASPAAVTAIDAMNAWGLTFIGLGLLFGVLARPAAIAGIVVLALYYVAAPPFPGLEYAMPAEGSYLIVNKVLVELAALVVVVAFPTSRLWGLDRLIFGPSARSAAAPAPAVARAPAARPTPEPEPEPTEEVHA